MTEHLYTRTIGNKLSCDSIHAQLRSIVDEGQGELCGGVDGDEWGLDGNREDERRVDGDKREM